jgi:8-oxo-dGDP phosphatase
MMLQNPHIPWNVRSSEYIRRDQWIGVRADHCVTSTGVEIAPYYVLEYPDWVHIIALDEDDNLVLVKQYRHGIASTSIEVPAGRMDADDDGPLAAAARELAEETGYISGDLRLVGTFSPNPATHANRIHTVLALRAERRVDITLDAAEDISVEIVPYREALRLVRSGAIVHAPQIASLLVALAEIGKLEL